MELFEFFILNFIMEKKIDAKNFVEKNLLNVYQEVDGFYVIENLLLFKGCDIAGATKCVYKKHLDQIALLVYNLKSNPTNKLYVGLVLDRFYLENDLVTSSGKIRVPTSIYEKVKAINNQYKK